MYPYWLLHCCSAVAFIAARFGIIFGSQNFVGIMNHSCSTSLKIHSQLLTFYSCLPYSPHFLEWDGPTAAECKIRYALLISPDAVTQTHLPLP